MSDIIRSFLLWGYWIWLDKHLILFYGHVVVIDVLRLNNLQQIHAGLLMTVFQITFKLWGSLISQMWSEQN